MTIPSPNLDDRDFEALVSEAVDLIRGRRGPWDDLGHGDPGMILLEAFAYLTDVLLYRLNRVPEKAHVEYLRLLGLTVGPPSAASVTLQLSGEDLVEPLSIPAGTAVEASDLAGRDPVTFLTDSAVVVAAGEVATVSAHHCRQVDAELLGVSSGEPGQRFTVAQGPIVLPTGNDRDLVVAVEGADRSDVEQGRGIDVAGRPFLIWPLVETFAVTDADSPAVLVDRAAGVVQFAPAIRRPAAGGSGRGGVAQDPLPLAAVPPAGREIRAWYRCGGGDLGNVAARTIDGEISSAAGTVTVTNPQRAAGGRDTETVAAAVERAGQLFHEPRRAVTADDFEALATGHGAVSRARAITAAEQWAHAVPGTVDLHLVASSGPVGPNESPEILDAVAALLAERQPLGVSTRVMWARFKRVSISLQVIVAGSEDPASVEQRVAERLRATLDPRPGGDSEGWPFGQALRASNIYDAALREPGVRYAESVEITVDETPDREVTVVAVDHHQPSTWYAASGPTLFRSQDDGTGWEAIWAVPAGEITQIVPAADRPGAVAVVGSRLDGLQGSSELFLSDDCGTTFPTAAGAAFTWNEGEPRHQINDLCWLPAGHDDDLLLATDRGLYRYRRDGQENVRVAGTEVEPGYWAVRIIARSSRDVTIVAALKQGQGVELGVEGELRPVGLAQLDIRRLAVERRGIRSFVWAMVAVTGDDTGHGCLRAEVVGAADAQLQWVSLDAGWNGGSCRELAFTAHGVVAASELNGVLRRDDAEPGTPWQPPRVDCGLPLQQDRRFQRIWSIAGQGGVAMAATDVGLWRTADGASYQRAAQRTSSELVTIPPAWLFASGDHRVEVRSEGR